MTAKTTNRQLLSLHITLINTFPKSNIRSQPSNPNKTPKTKKSFSFFTDFIFTEDITRCSL